MDSLYALCYRYSVSKSSSQLRSFASVTSPSISFAFFTDKISKLRLFLHGYSTNHLFQRHLWTFPVMGLRLQLKYSKLFSTVLTNNLIRVLFLVGCLTLALRFYTLCPKNKTRVILHIFYSCKSIAMKYNR